MLIASPPRGRRAFVYRVASPANGPRAVVTINARTHVCARWSSSCTAEVAVVCSVFRFVAPLAASCQLGGFVPEHLVLQGWCLLTWGSRGVLQRLQHMGG